MSYEELEDDEWVDEDDGTDVLLACPACGAEVHEETQQCPSCRDWIIPVDPADRTRRRIWAVAAILLVVSMLLFAIL